MSEVFGTVKALRTKSITSRKNGKSYTVHVADVTTTGGEDVEIEFGFNKPSGISEGDFYQFEVERNYGKLQVKNLTKSTASDAPAPTPALAAPKRDFVQKQFPVPVNHPDRSIIRQNALQHATRLFVGRLDEDVSVNNLDSAADEIIRLAYKFEAYATGDLEEEELKKLADADEGGE